MFCSASGYFQFLDASANPWWFDLFKAVVPGIPAFIVACAVACLTWGQLKVAKGKLNLDLYKERYEIFFATWGFLSGTAKENALGYSPEFTNLIPKARFLFGSEIADYMTHIHSETVDLKMTYVRYSTPNQPMSSEDIKKCQRISNYLANEAIHGVHEKFSKYLDFSRWTSST